MIDSRVTVRRLITIAALVAMWCALWGEVTVANLVSGLTVALLIAFSRIGPAESGGIRIGPLLRLVGIVAVDLVKSTQQVVWEVLTPTDRTEESVIAVQVPAESRSHLLLLVVAITLTPGTAVVDTDPDAGILFLHLLHHERRAETAEHVQQLAALACEALPPSPNRAPSAEAAS